MNKEFIPYQESLELKELGFDEECFAMYMKDIFKSRCWCKNSEFGDKILFTSAPTLSQAFRWFREKYKLYHDIKMFGDWDKPQFSYIVSGRTMTNPAHMWHYEDENSYEEAELACLKKLIEIVKQQKLNHDLMSGDIVGY